MAAQKFRHNLCGSYFGDSYLTLRIKVRIFRFSDTSGVESDRSAGL
jgi:hypothetical protein